VIPQAHFFGYEGRACLPSDFDAQYCYALGHTACGLLKAGLTGYMSNVRNLHRPISEWQVGGAPITMMMNVERRHGKAKPVIQKVARTAPKPLVCMDSSRVLLTASGVSVR